MLLPHLYKNTRGADHRLTKPVLLIRRTCFACLCPGDRCCCALSEDLCACTVYYICTYAKLLVSQTMPLHRPQTGSTTDLALTEVVGIYWQTPHIVRRFGGCCLGFAF